MKKAIVKITLQYEVSDKDILNKDNEKIIKDLAERKATEMMLFDIIEKKEIPNISYETEIKDSLFIKAEKFLAEKYPHTFEVLDKVEKKADTVTVGYYVKMYTTYGNYVTFVTEKFKVSEICQEAEKETM